MEWKDLSLSERAELIKIGTRNGLTSIKDIKDMYNTYKDGGNTKDSQYYDWLEKEAERNSKEWGMTTDEAFLQMANTSDYNYREYYNNLGKKADNGHYPDTYKTVYHPTFSTDSMYSGVKDPNFNPKGIEGGSWVKNRNIYIMPEAKRGNLSERIKTQQYLNVFEKEPYTVFSEGGYTRNAHHYDGESEDSQQVNMKKESIFNKVVRRIGSAFAPTYNTETFPEAFRQARIDGRKYFKWEGNPYNTELTSDEDWSTFSKDNYTFSQAYRAARSRQLPTFIWNEKEYDSELKPVSIQTNDFKPITWKDINLSNINFLDYQNSLNKEQIIELNNMLKYTKDSNISIAQTLAMINNSWAESNLKNVDEEGGSSKGYYQMRSGEGEDYDKYQKWLFKNKKKDSFASQSQWILENKNPENQTTAYSKIMDWTNDKEKKVFEDVIYKYYKDNINDLEGKDFQKEIKKFKKFISTQHLPNAKTHPTTYFLACVHHGITTEKAKEYWNSGNPYLTNIAFLSLYEQAGFPRYKERSANMKNLAPLFGYDTIDKDEGLQYYIGK